MRALYARMGAASVVRLMGLFRAEGVRVRPMSSLGDGSVLVSINGAAEIYDEDHCGSGNGIGRMTTMSDPVGTSTRCYERRGLLFRTADANETLIDYGYDADGNRDRISYPAGFDAAYTYDFADRPSSVSAFGASIVASATYLPFSPITELAFGNDTTRTMTYTSRYLPSENQLVGPEGTIAHYTYATNAAGDITQIHDASSAAYNRDFAYDDLHRLVTATSGASLWGTGGYTYDAMGNMKTLTLGTRSLTFNYSGTTPKLQSVSGTTPVTVTYDAAGNETSSGTYSARNLLQSTGTFSSGTTYQYDGRGVRIGETVHQGQQVTPSTFVYSPELHLLERSAWDPNCAFHGCKDFSADYIWFGNEPVAQISFQGEIRYTFTDHLGTPILQTDAGAGVVWRAEYEPFGAIYQYRTGAAYNQILRLPGQEQTATRSDTYYNIFRWYKPGWGRYTQADPLGVGGLREFATMRQNEGFTSNGSDLYSYVHSDPVNLLDSLGLDDMTANPHNLEKLLDLYERGGSGNRETERSSFITQQVGPGSIDCNLWPWGAAARMESWPAGKPWPDDVIANAHTHPRSGDARPSTNDRNNADRVRIPFYTVTPSGIFKYDPQAQVTTQEEGSDWVARATAVRQLHKREGVQACICSQIPR
jgi:RHS repeat-associated protein